MTRIADLPVIVALLVAVLLIAGSTLVVLGTLGLVRMRSFYDRLHPPTLGTSFGVLTMAAASMLLFSVLGGRLVVHEAVIAMLVMITTPVTLLMLGRASLRRDRAKGDPTLPEAVRESLAAKRQAQEAAQAEAIAAEKAADEAEAEAKGDGEGHAAGGEGKTAGGEASGTGAERQG